MDSNQKNILSKIAGSSIEFECPMSQYTTFRVGGPAEALYRASDLITLQKMVSILNQEKIPYLIVGRGSNLLVRDKGIAGVVIVLEKSLGAIEVKDKNSLTIFVGAGCSINTFLTMCLKSGWSGLEFLAGIPGTIGGALAMNAGAFGQEIGNNVQKIDLIDRQGQLLTRDKNSLNFHYRKLMIDQGSVIIGCYFQLEGQSKLIIQKRITNYLKKRKLTQPLDYPCAGSIFKNPANDYAGRLIEEAGLKGTILGGAMISEKHANFIIDTGNALAKDVSSLITLVQEAIENRQGIKLQPEIVVVGKEV